MPATFTYPGIYVEEVPSGVHPITGASTSDTAFVDYFPRGPVDTATRVGSLEDYERRFGGPDRQSLASYSVRQFFLNGGQTAWIVRVIPDDTPDVATRLLTASSPPQSTLRVDAANPGAWGSNLQVAAVQTVPANPAAFNLFVREAVPDGSGGTQIVASEVHRNLTMAVGAASHAVAVVNAASSLIRLSEPSGGIGQVPTLSTPQASGDPPDTAWQSLSTVTDTTVYDSTSGNPVSGFPDALQDGLSALDRIAPFRFNLLCVPAAAALAATDAKATVDAAAAYAREKRAFLLVDPPAGLADAAAAQAWLLGATAPAATPNAAVYFPRVSVADPLNPGRTREIGASGTMAGIYARTDATRGTWKAPAGIDATIAGGVPALNLNNDDSAVLNPLAINALRTFPVIGSVAWGARTLFGADQRASEWKYVPVRRMALYIENSLVDGLGWVVFEPNDAPLHAQIRLNVGAFMQDLFRQGAFQGATPREAYLVKCDRTTTTQSDIDRGIVNILVGFAPLKPAEFVVIRIQQLAGQTQT
ncbi:MAG TPA: phage tail sheath C-terminal domain-containing protein [Actinomycetota bacterium]|nr:phage tail sheath C-terminal domain-containing protein [Actinomycetota bacterium]